MGWAEVAVGWEEADLMEAAAAQVVASMEEASLVVSEALGAPGARKVAQVAAARVSRKLPARQK